MRFSPLARSFTSQVKMAKAGILLLIQVQSLLNMQPATWQGMQLSRMERWSSLSAMGCPAASYRIGIWKGCRGTNPAVTFEMAWETILWYGYYNFRRWKRTETFTSNAGANTQYYSSYSGEMPAKALCVAAFLPPAHHFEDANRSRFLRRFRLNRNVQEYYVCVNAGITGNPSSAGLAKARECWTPTLATTIWQLASILLFR